MSTSALTIARNKAGQHVYLYKDQTVDSAALDAEDVKRLKDEGFLADYTGAGADDAAEAADPAAGNVKDVLAAVGTDKAKAQAALDAEKAKGDDARGSLVDKLQAIVDKQD